MTKEALHNPTQGLEANRNHCSVCRNLLVNMQRFFEMLDTARRAPDSEWLTVRDVADQLKISKAIVYRLIRTGELKAVNIVPHNGELPQKGHYRIRRADLSQYLASKTTHHHPRDKTEEASTAKRFKVANHLGL